MISRRTFTTWLLGLMGSGVAALGMPQKADAVVASPAVPWDLVYADLAKTLHVCGCRVRMINVDACRHANRWILTGRLVVLDGGYPPESHLRAELHEEVLKLCPYLDDAVLCGVGWVFCALP